MGTEIDLNLARARRMFRDWLQTQFPGGIIEAAEGPLWLAFMAGRNSANRAIRFELTAKGEWALQQHVEVLP